MKRIVLAILVLLSMHESAAAADRVRIGYSSISGAYTPIWVAHDAGYFAKEGLQDDIILIPSGTQLAQVTVAGEIDIGSLNGSSAIAAALSGADLKIIGNSGNKMVFSLYVRPEIKTVEAMKGKKIGITRFGSAPDISVRYALRKFNINPDKDLTLIQLGFMATVAAGLQGGSIEGGVVSPPTQFAIEKAGRLVRQAAAPDRARQAARAASDPRRSAGCPRGRRRCAAPAPRSVRRRRTAAPKSASRTAVVARSRGPTATGIRAAAATQGPRSVRTRPAVRRPTACAEGHAARVGSTLKCSRSWRSK